jgi:hypothetical protein
MARKAFLADIVAASEKNIPNIVSISRGDDDGDINFCYIHETAEPVDIGLLAMGTFSCLRRSTCTTFLSCFSVVSQLFLSCFSVVSQLFLSWLCRSFSFVCNGKSSQSQLRLF